MENDIYLALQNGLKTNEPVKFYNTFRGMPVNFSGYITKIIGHRVSFKVSSLQIFNILLNKGTYVKVKPLNGVLRAQLADYDLQNEEVGLWGFEHQTHMIGIRSEVRVEPGQTLGALLTASKDLSLPVTIYNLSIGGMRFMFDIKFFDPGLFTIDKRMSVLFFIPASGNVPKGAMIHYDLEVRNVMMDLSKKYISIGARSLMDRKFENYLVSYLAHRQKELLVELKALCKAVMV